jgi:hypothetical protein
LLSPFFVRHLPASGRCRLQAALSNIAAVERNHFLFQELIDNGQNRAIGELARFDAGAALFVRRIRLPSFRRRLRARQ